MLCTGKNNNLIGSSAAAVRQSKGWVNMLFSRFNVLKNL